MLLDLHTHFSGKVVRYSHLFKNFPLFVVIHIVKGFSVVNEAKVVTSLHCILDLVGWCPEQTGFILFLTIRCERPRKSKSGLREILVYKCHQHTLFHLQLLKRHGIDKKDLILPDILPNNDHYGTAWLNQRLQ